MGPAISIEADFVVAALISSASICEGDAPCALGSGGGLGVRVGWRPTPAWTFSFAYEVTRHDAHKTIPIAILQQPRLEARWFFPEVWGFVPYAMLGGGLALHGNNWSVDGWGPGGLVALGAQLQMSRNAGMNFAIGYRPVWLNQWVDRPGGLASFLGVEIGLWRDDTFW